MSEVPDYPKYGLRKVECGISSFRIPHSAFRTGIRLRGQCRHFTGLPPLICQPNAHDRHEKTLDRNSSHFECFVPFIGKTQIAPGAPPAPGRATCSMRARRAIEPPDLKTATSPSPHP